ncbi:MAG: hypothetical protein QM706_20780 [Nitrospira sp.]
MRWNVFLAYLLISVANLSLADMVHAGQEAEKAQKSEGADREYMRKMQDTLNTNVMNRDFSPGDRRSIDAALEQAIKNNTPSQLHQGDLEQAGKSADDAPNDSVREQMSKKRIPKQKD